MGAKHFQAVASLVLLLAGNIVRGEGTTNSPWSRMVMIGASASAGFMLSEPFGGTNTIKCRLSYYVDAAIKPEHPSINNMAHAMFFMAPEAAGPAQVDHALARSPTVVYAVDFMFWFCYGRGTTDAERAQRFEGGLKMLDAIKCPLVVGDVPDASFATNTGIISVAQVPSPQARNAANRRLREWAAMHPNVIVVPLEHFMSTAMANKELSIHGHTIPAGKSHAILQNDELHPNPRGAAILALGVLDALVTSDHEISTNDIRWDAAQVYRLGYESAKPASPIQKQQ